MPTYTRSDLKSRINAGIKGKIGILVDADETINQVVRDVISEIDLRSVRRKATLQPGVFDEVLAYPSPTDIKAQKLVSLSNQTDSNDVYFGYNLIPFEQFNQKYGNSEISFSSQRELYTVAFDDQSMVRRMLIASPQDGVSLIISGLDSLTDGGGLWTSFGDAENVDADTGNKVRGEGSIKFDIDATGGTTAGIYNATLDTFDITSFLESNSSYFDFPYVSNAEDIVNYTIRIGIDDTNYYEMVVTATHFNTVFATGWNVLRFDATSATLVGTVDTTACRYVALFMTKDAAKISQSTFRFDNIIARNGEVMNIRYYSKYGWQTQAGVWLENSTRDDDFLNADTDEFNMFIEMGVVVAGNEVDENKASELAQARYLKKKGEYVADNPSGALVETSDYQAQYYV